MGKFFKALPAYIGGKRRLCRLIFALLDTAVPRYRWRDLTFLDPFLGGGSVSLFAKAQGFRVLCNDLAVRSAAIGRALIVNSSETLAPGDLGALLREHSHHHPRRAEECYSPSVFSKAHARLLDRALYNLAGFSEPKRSLAIVLLVKWVLRIQPMSMLRGTDARAAFSGDLDRVSPHRLGHYLKSGRLLTPQAWLLLAEEVNSGVFPGRGQAHQADALAFLAAIHGDVVYLDPPYPGTTSYEREYAVLDDLLEGKRRRPSAFSRSPDLLPQLFQACRHIPVWLISLNNAALSLEELLDLVRRYRSMVQALAIPYRHLGSIASEEKNETNREFVILATE
jgi:adenine-specific DNA-methyltransferase